MRGGPGRDRYAYARGDGADVIEEHGLAGEEDRVEFSGDIAPGEVEVRRSGDDLVLDIGSGSDRITIREWFTADAMRVERVRFGTGAEWDAATLAAAAGEMLPPAEPPADPPLVPPAEPDSGPPPVTDETPVPSSDSAIPSDAATPSDPAPTSDSTPPPGTAGPAPAVPPTATPSELPAGPLAALPSAAAASASAASVSGARSEPAPGPSAPPAGEGAAPGVHAGPAATIETLAASGFVSPGRPAAVPVEASPESTDGEAPAESSASDALADSPAPDAMAAYWRWMHARLDAHFAASELDDLGAPPMHDYLPFARAYPDALQALAPSRAVGIRVRGAFDARGFDGLRDGLSRLG
jgi:hypothetical protein